MIQLPCFASAVQGSGCGLSDTKCQCTTGNAKITESVTACAPSKCSAEDLQSKFSSLSSEFISR